MANRFTKAEWDKIIATLEADPEGFGLPEGGREGSLVLASFNIRKLSSSRNRERELEFMARFCARCDLVAIQEVQDNLEGLRHLKERTEAQIAASGEFGLLVSDITGEVPGESGMAERLAFLYRKRRVRRAEMASDLTFDRTAVLARFFGNEAAIISARRKYEHELERLAAGERKSKPTFVLPAFVTFVRTPHVAAFEVPAANDAPPLTFAAVNAHLVYGKPVERRQEFEALVDWMTNRVRDADRMAAPNLILLGDLNLDFDQPVKDRGAIGKRIRSLNEEVFGKPEARRVYFPFIDDDPRSGKVIRTNARNNQTFDQIAFFLGPREARLPNDRWRALAASDDPDGFSYGVFNFADLFSRSIKDKAYLRLTKAERSDLGKKFEHKVSDHMPIWVRLPRPGFRPPPSFPAP